MPPSAVDQIPSQSAHPNGTRVLGFRAAHPSNSPQSPDETTTSSTGEELPEELAPASGDEWPDESPERLDDTPSPASSRASDQRPTERPLEEGLRDMFRGGVAVAGDQAHNYLARTEGAKTVRLYTTDEQDQASIGDPLARIAQRHQGIGELSPDTQDLMAAMVGLTRYATKQINKRNDARALDAGATSTPQPMPEAVDL